MLARGIEINDEHSAILESQFSNSIMKITAFAYMAGTLEEVTRKFEEQARVQREHYDMLQTQQGSINDHKKMLAILLDRKKKKSPKKSRFHASSSKGKGKEKEGETLPLKTLIVRTLNLKILSFRLKRKGIQKAGIIAPRG